MKKLAVHIDKLNSIIAIRDDEDPQLIKIITAENISLFKHPELFAPRLINLIENNLGTRNQKFISIDLIFPEHPNSFSRENFRSNFLDLISYSSSYDGFDFDKYFKEYFTHDAIPRVNLVSHYDAFTKQISFISSFKHPSIIILLHLNSIIGFVHKNGDNKIFDDKDFMKNKEEITLDKYVGDEGIFDILKNRTENISEIYSSRLNVVVKNIIPIVETYSLNYRSITIVSKHKYLINPQLIWPYSKQLLINLIQPDINFAITCCGLSPAAYVNKELESKEDLSELILAK